MARKNSLTAKNLAALGAERLAAFLMELGASDPSVRKRLVLVVAEGGGRDAIVKAVNIRLSALSGSRAEIAWEKARAYASELDGLRSAIAETLGPVDARAAAERLIQFIRLAPRVFERVDDSNGRFDAIFRRAVEDLGTVCGLVGHRDPEVLAGEVFSLIQSDEYGVCDNLVDVAAPVLGEAGLAALAELARTAMTGGGKPTKPHAFDWSKRRLQRVLGDIADAQNDVDAFIAIATATAEEGTLVDVLGIASRLIEAGRAGEALAWLDQAAPPSSRRIIRDDDELADRYTVSDQLPRLDRERELLRVRALEQLGRRPEAQEVRWRLFEQTLNCDLLREYIRFLPDFEDYDALDRAFGLAAAHRNVLLALAFLGRWPNLDAAAKLTMERSDEIDGRNYEVLNVVAEALAEAHPHAATLIYRRMIDSVLERGMSKSYRYAAKNLADCAQLADQVEWAKFALQSHSDYVAALNVRHGRKVGFWSLVKS